jgi:succinate dehydrogenase / fumarate reductase iron-sulfur subunit
MVAKMNELGFGGCSNHGECEAACPKGVSIDFIARLNRDYLGGSLLEKPEPLSNV